MTLIELREACAKVADNAREAAEYDCKMDAAQRLEHVAVDIRAISLLPAPVDDEFARYTPGPWRVLGATVVDTQGDEVAMIPVNSGYTYAMEAANLHLIAAAPRLLRERNEAREALENELVNGPTAEEWRRAVQERDAARAERDAALASAVEARQQADALRLELAEARAVLSDLQDAFCSGLTLSAAEHDALMGRVNHCLDEAQLAKGGG